MANMEAYIQGQSEEVRSDMYTVAERVVREVIGNMDGHGQAYNAGLCVKAHNVISISASSSSSTTHSGQKNKEHKLKAMEDSILARMESMWSVEFPAAVERGVQAALGHMGYGYPPQPYFEFHPFPTPFGAPPTFPSAAIPFATPPAFPAVATPVGFSQEYMDRHGVP